MEDDDIIEGWKSFRQTMLGIGATPQQIDGMKTAFWSGAIWAAGKVLTRIDALEKKHGQDHAGKNAEA